MCNKLYKKSFLFAIINSMKSKNKILDSIEEFVALPLSILKNRLIQITGYKSDFVTNKKIDIELTDDTVQINCVNSENAYNLLSSVIYKRRLNQKKRLEAQRNAEKVIEKLGA